MAAEEDRIVVASVISEALEHKYPSFDAIKLATVVKNAWKAIADIPDESALLAQLCAIDGLAEDITNHVIVLEVIARFWSREPVRGPIGRLHQAIMNAPDMKRAKRVTHHVADFGGEVPTKLIDVEGALNELELLVERFMRPLGSQSASVQSVFLAHLFSSIVRVHPFQDGNGRTARLVVQYCLKSWDRSFMPIPKVRNSLQWRAALEQAIAGDIGPLTFEFESRLMQG